MQNTGHALLLVWHHSAFPTTPQLQHAAAKNAHYVARVATTSLQVKGAKEARDKEKEDFRVAMDEVTVSIHE